MGFYGKDLAQVHDEAYCAHAAAAAACAERLLKGLPKGTLVYDLGCGTGLTTRALLRRGFKVAGVDASPGMLAIARKRAPGARFTRGSLYGLRLHACGAVLAIGEVLNYTARPAGHKSAAAAFFRRVHAALRPGGVFLFDLAGPGQVPGGRGRSWTAGRGWHVLVDKREDGRGVLRRGIITLMRSRGGLRRGEETHVQKLLEPSWTAAQLRAAGFSVKVLPGYGRYRLDQRRYAVLAVKPPGSPAVL